MKKYLFLIITLILISCNTRVKDYSIQVQGKLYRVDTIYSVGINLITDSTLVDYYELAKELPNINTSISLSYWYEMWYSHNVKSNLQQYDFKDYDIRIKGLVKDPNTDEVYIINKHYLSK